VTAPDPTAGMTAVRRLALSRLLSFAGSMASVTAIVYTILEQTGSVLLVSIAIAVTFGVAGVLMPVFGAVIDHVDRQRIMIASDLIGMALYVAIIFLIHHVAVLLTLAALSAVAELAFLAASQAAMPALIGNTKLLDRANAWIVGARSGGLLVGPLLGGGVYALVGVKPVFAINAVSFVLSALLVTSIRRPFSERRYPTHIPLHNLVRMLGAGARTGFRLAWRDPDLRRLTLAETIQSLALGWVLVAEAPLAKLFDVGAFGYGLLTATWGVGMIIAAPAVGRLDWAGAYMVRRIVCRDRCIALVHSTRIMVRTGSGFCAPRRSRQWLHGCLPCVPCAAPHA
jgi:MFS family permease